MDAPWGMVTADSDSAASSGDDGQSAAKPLRLVGYGERPQTKWKWVGCLVLLKI